MKVMTPEIMWYYASWVTAYRAVARLAAYPLEDGDNVIAAFHGTMETTAGVLY